MYAELKRIICPECGEQKPVRFYKTAKRCRDCATLLWKRNKATRRSAERKKSPGRHKKADFAGDLKKNYGLSIDEYQKIYMDQKGCCACCGSHESKFKRKLHIDHDHDGGQVRALLCPRCNPGLGYFEDSIEKLEMAIAYLRKFKN